jgi:hypothetical protein
VAPPEREREREREGEREREREGGGWGCQHVFLLGIKLPELEADHKCTFLIFRLPDHR